MLPFFRTSKFLQYNMINLRNSRHRYIVDLVDTQDLLVKMGAKETDTNSAAPEREYNQGAGVHLAGDGAGGWMIDVAEAQDNTELSVPKLDFLARDATLPVVPQQRKVTGYIIRRYNPHVEAKKRALPHILQTLEMQKSTVVKLQDDTSVLKPFMKEFSCSVKHSLMAWMAQFDSSKFRSFPKDIFQTWWCLSTGQQPPQVADAFNTGKVRCRGCKGFIDYFGHHQQCCAAFSAGTWTQVHNDLQYTWMELASLANVQSTANAADLPRPDDSNRHADIFFAMTAQGSRHGRAVVGDVRVVHPWKGNPADVTQMGQQNKNALRDAVQEKNVKHKAYLEDKGYTFLPLAATTHGALNDEAIRLIMLFAHHKLTRTSPRECLSASRRRASTQRLSWGTGPASSTGTRPGFP